MPKRTHIAINTAKLNTIHSNNTNTKSHHQSKTANYLATTIATAAIIIISSSSSSSSSSAAICPHQSSDNLRPLLPEVLLSLCVPEEYQLGPL